MQYHNKTDKIFSKNLGEYIHYPKPDFIRYCDVTDIIWKHFKVLM